MNIFVEKLFEKDFSQMLFGENKQEHNFIVISTESISEDNRKISNNEIDIHIYDNPSLAKEIEKLFGVHFKEECNNKFRQVGTLQIPYFPKSYFYNGEFAFRGISIKPCINADGKYIIPSCFRFFFNDIFRLWRKDIVFEDGEVSFVEYTGHYPAYCTGETILEHKSASGVCKIRTHFIKHSITKWELNIPWGLQMLEAKLPKELKEWHNEPTECCGGCNW